jgi:siroheme synthase-like protein
VVTVIAPEPGPPMEELAQSGAIALERRAYVAGEAQLFQLVLAATDDRAVNHDVSVDARQAGVWVNVADDPELCTFHLPARVRRGALQIALFSDGQAPFASRRLRQCLERRFTPAWELWVRTAGEFRTRVKALHLTSQQEEVLFDAFFDSTVDPGSLACRVPSASEQDAWLATVRK